MLFLTVKLDFEYPADEECHRKKNKMRDTLKNLCIKNKAWNFKKHHYRLY